MATLKQRILELITKQPGLTDRQIADILEGPGSRQQPVNQACNSLQRSGELVRATKPDGRIGNFLPEGQTLPPQVSQRQSQKSESLSEDFVKRAVGAWLRSQGWEVKIAWGGEHGADILAQRSADRWIIEAKGHGGYPQKQGNYFLNGLSELMQRMDNPATRYSLAFPDIPRYRGLWERLPSLVKKRLGFSMLFVDDNGEVRIV